VAFSSRILPCGIACYHPFQVSADWLIRYIPLPDTNSIMGSIFDRRLGFLSQGLQSLGVERSDTQTASTEHLHE
jgi:hypothetical protein